VNAALTSNDGLIGVRPVINYEATFRPSFGVLYFNDRLPHGMQMRLSSALGGPEVLAQDARLTIPLVPRAVLEVRADYQRRDDELYSGIGMRQPLPYARYAFDRVDGTVALALTPKRILKIDLAGDVGWRRFGNGSAYAGDAAIADVYCVHGVDGRCSSGRVDENLVPGFARGTQFVRARGDLHVDSRKDELGSGVLFDAGVQYTHGFGNDRSSYLRGHLHLGGSFELWRHRTLYLGVSADDEVAFGDAPIPFSELVQLGGVDDLRGFRRGQFRDGSSLLATAEYRWPIWMWMDGAIFTDYGAVFKPQFTDFSAADLRPDIGFGVRVRSSSKYLVRIQVAYGFGDGGGFRLVIAGNGNPS